MGIVEIVIISAYALSILLFLAIMAFLIWQFVNSMRFGKVVPYVPVPSGAIPGIIGSLHLSENACLYDLGCGDGRVLFAAKKTYPGARIIGIEKSIWLCLFIRMKNLFLSPEHRIEIYRRDLLQVNVSGATHIFIYLLPYLLNKLQPRLKEQLQTGVRVVSCDFVFENQEPVEVVHLHQNRKKIARVLSVYAF